MRKFKLIKTYPGGPRTLGLEVFQNGEWYESKFATKNVEHFHKPLNIVESFPDFWEEIFESDFEILRVSDGFNEYYRSANGKFTINLTHFYDISNFVREGSLIDGMKILSVKRLADGIIFIVNDVITSKNHPFKEVYKLFEIELVNNTIRLIPKNWEYNNLSCYLPLDLMIKVSNIKPFFKTEDDVDIFPGDTVHYVLSNFSKRKYTPTGDYRKLKEIHYFSSEEKADEYIEFCKPKYSMEYIKEALKPHLGVFQHFQFYTENIKKI